MDVETLQNLISGCPACYRASEFMCKEKTRKNEAFLCRVDLTVRRRTLASVSLIDSKLKKQRLENLVVGLPLLERLTLNRCWGLNKLISHSQSLKYFFFNEVRGFEAAFDTPNMVYLSCEGKAKSMFFMNSLINLFEVIMKLINRSWYFRMLLSLTSIVNCSNTMSLYLHSEEVYTNKYILVF